MRPLLVGYWLEEAEKWNRSRKLAIESDDFETKEHNLVLDFPSSGGKLGTSWEKEFKAENCGSKLAVVKSDEFNSLFLFSFSTHLTFSFGSPFGSRLILNIQKAYAGTGVHRERRVAFVRRGGWERAIAQESDRRAAGHMLSPVGEST